MHIHTYAQMRRCILPAAPPNLRTSSAAGPRVGCLVWLSGVGWPSCRSGVSPDHQECALEVAVGSTESQCCGLRVYCECLVRRGGRAAGRAVRCEPTPEGGEAAGRLGFGDTASGSRQRWAFRGDCSRGSLTLSPRGGGAPSEHSLPSPVGPSGLFSR